ncbi:MAG: hypothetical protein A2X84_04220 [Desulfuromonadaceae bacterium GWC2_58_13]|nr:MAG: hypothetical protein A2X84_04220 [Desulfuromonadaceae bacterium GWC2_58_13]
MEILPTNTATLVVQATSAATTVSRDERHHELQLHQMIRATVEEGGQQKALLQFGDRRLWVETGIPLKAGDTLNLQVVETQPTVSFKIIEPTILQRLGQSLHLLGNQLDVLELLPAMLEGRDPGSKKLDPEVRDALVRLFTLLKKSPEQLNSGDLRSLPRQLGLYQEADLLTGQMQNARATLKNALGQIEADHNHRLGELASHLEPLFGAIARIPELLRNPTSAGAILQTQPSSLAAVLRPLLRLAQSLPEPPPSASPPVIPTAIAATTAAELPPQNHQETIRALVRALGEYLQPTLPLPPQTLNRLEQQLRPLPEMLQNSAGPDLLPTPAPSQSTDLLDNLARLLRSAPEQSTTAGMEPLSKQLANALQKALVPPPRADGTPPSIPAIPSQPEPSLTRLAEVLAEIPTVIRQPGQVGRFLESQPAELTAVLRPLLRLAAATGEPPVSIPSPQGRPASEEGASARQALFAQASPPQVLSRQEVGQLATEFVRALREYMQPFAGVTSESIERIEQQAAMLQQVFQGPFEQALAAIGQKPLGKDLLGALFHLLRHPPERLAEGQGAQLSRQIIDALQKIVEQENGRIEEKQEDSRRHLELWQLCRARFGDTDTSFVPLPLPFLDNGFMIAHRQPSQESETGTPEEIVSLSLFLDLQKLGPLQVDLLYQNEELFVRFKCVDQAAADFVSAASGELGEALGNIRVSTVAVGTGAESPDRALIRKMIPPEKGILDARV